MLAPKVTTAGSSVMSARSPNRMLLSHPSTPPATARIAIRKHPRMILFLAVSSVRPNFLLSLCLIYISTLPANTVLVKKPPIKCLQTCQFNHDRSGGQTQASSSAPALIFSICPARRRRRRSCTASVRSFRTFQFLQPEDRTMKRSWRPSAPEQTRSPTLRPAMGNFLLRSCKNTAENYKYSV